MVRSVNESGILHAHEYFALILEPDQTGNIDEHHQSTPEPHKICTFCLAHSKKALVSKSSYII